MAVTALINKTRVQSQKMRKHNINERVTLPVTQRFFSRPAGDFAQLQSTNQICRWVSCYYNSYGTRTSAQVRRQEFFQGRAPGKSS